MGELFWYLLVNYISLFYYDGFLDFLDFINLYLITDFTYFLSVLSNSLTFSFNIISFCCKFCNLSFKVNLYLQKIVKKWTHLKKILKVLLCEEKCSYLILLAFLQNFVTYDFKQKKRYSMKNLNLHDIEHKSKTNMFIMIIYSLNYNVK